MDYKAYQDINDGIVIDMEMYIHMSNMPENEEVKEQLTQIIAANASISILLTSIWSKLQLPPAMEGNKY